MTGWMINRKDGCKGDIFMKRQIRHGVFETNSSSTHSLTMCSEEEFEDWKRGKVLFDESKGGIFVSVSVMNDYDKKMAENNYENTKDIFQKDWRDLAEEAKEKYYFEYAKENGIIDEDSKTYEEYMGHGSLEKYVEHYTSKSGDKIVAFGEYGYD